jgi:hypothetical protein
VASFTTTITSVDVLRALPSSYALEQNFPNPFNPATTIQYALPELAHVTITLFNAAGQELARLVDAVQPAGYREVHVDLSRLPSGVYFYRLEAVGEQGGPFRHVKRMVLVK